MPIASRIVIGVRIQGVITAPFDGGATNWYVHCFGSDMKNVSFSNRQNCRVAYITI